MSAKLRQKAMEIATKIKNDEQVQIHELELLREELTKFADELSEEGSLKESLLMYNNLTRLSPSLTIISAYEICDKPKKWKKNYESSIECFKKTINDAEKYSNYE